MNKSTKTGQEEVDKTVYQNAINEFTEYKNQKALHCFPISFRVINSQTADKP